MGYHRWLDGNHRFRFQRTLFDGTEEFREAPQQTQGPNRVVKRYSAFIINGFRFHTKYCERLRRT
ncbi:hypothetical protein J1N35_033226 [Gossypium stocksii]|uniref:Uncharacterized protein n=1 Tax=Gossypium stocksii TaxID=47602 RepID=A0A9D3ZN53_9ROSI|nr:hypothetical protein J1N35_033226 [Gossypium stocksii]